MIAAGKRRKRSCPFVGPGLNCHFTDLPLDLMQAIGINWVRIDTNDSLTQTMIEDKLAHYTSTGWTKDNILWLIPHYADTPQADVELLASLGIPQIEVGNETFGIWWQGFGMPAWNAAQYRDFVLSMREAAGEGPTFYGCGPSDTPEQEQVYAAGVAIDIDSLHPYRHDNNLPLVPGPLLEMEAITGRPAVCTEVSYFYGDTELGYDPPPTSEVAGAFFTGLRAVMDNRPWCYYDGPKSLDPIDHRGLFQVVAGEWVPTDTYNFIAASTL